MNAQRSIRSQLQNSRELKPYTRWVRTPVEIPRGKRLRALIYGRYSTTEQSPRSIEAQVGFCKKFLHELGVENYDLTVISDEGVSGEQRDRPGIDQVWEGIRQRRWDLLVSEDSSRIYRDDVFCVGLVRLAMDNGLRSLFINDYIDTADPEWEQRLKNKAAQHASRNWYTSNQIKRSHDERWEVDAALGLTRPGYLRITDNNNPDAPKFDEVDQKWVPIIREAYERIALGESPWSVANWLTEAGLPKVANSKTDKWTDKNVLALIRRPDYRGIQVYRTNCSKKVYSTGKRKVEPNAAEDILTREMPDLRIVDDDLWYRANDAIDARAPDVTPRRGFDNPQHGVARDSRTPVAGVFRCGLCGGKMWGAGRDKPSYRCSGEDSDACWNKATVLRNEAHDWIGGSIAGGLRAVDDAQLDRLVLKATELLNDGGAREATRARLEEEKSELVPQCDHLGIAIAKGTQESETLRKLLDAAEDRLARVKAELDALKEKIVHHAPPTRADIDKRREELIAAIKPMTPESRDAIKALVGTIHAVPYQQFDSNKVVLRAKFNLHLAALLPLRLQNVLAKLCDGPLHEHFEQISLLVDLFEPSTGPQYGRRAYELSASGKGLMQIARQLGINKRRANIATKYGKAMHDAGVTDPFKELTEAPATASRWKPCKPPATPPAA